MKNEENFMYLIESETSFVIYLHYLQTKDIISKIKNYKEFIYAEHTNNPLKRCGDNKHNCIMDKTLNQKLFTKFLYSKIEENDLKDYL